MKHDAGNNLPICPGWRVDLSALKLGDSDQGWLWINDPDINRNLMTVKPIMDCEEKDFFRGFPTRKSSDLLFGIQLSDIDDQSERLIGMTGLHRIRWSDQVATSGSLIGRKDLWGQGLGTEAKMLLLEYAFHTLNLRKICSSVLEHNRRSQGHLENCGYVQEGCRKSQVYREGRFVDEILLAVFRDSFEEQFKQYQAEMDEQYGSREKRRSR